MRTAAKIVGVGLVMIMLVFWPAIATYMATSGARYSLSNAERVPEKDYAIVFGAALRQRGTEPSNYLRWRIETAVQLYKQGSVSKILMTGDGSFPDHDEPAIMKREAIELGVPDTDIEMDKFGFDTFDSCYRARNGRDISNAIAVTQSYHLPRAVFSCQRVGIDTVGVAAVARYGRSFSAYDLLRESASTYKLYVQLAVRSVRN
jgi:vancomycin permeability regulator SanA